MLPEPQDAEAAGGAHAMLESGSTVARLILLDRLGEIEILDLRALGCVLWRVFVQEADVLPEISGNVGDAVTYEPLMLHSSESPLEPTAKVYDMVSLPPRDGLRRRLATLQRFVRSYRTAAPGLDRLLDRAATSFARWASGLSDIRPAGREGPRVIIYRLSMGYEVRLSRDAMGAV